MTIADMGIDEAALSRVQEAHAPDESQIRDGGMIDQTALEADPDLSSFTAVPGLTDEALFRHSEFAPAIISKTATRWRGAAGGMAWCICVTITSSASQWRSRAFKPASSIMKKPSPVSLRKPSPGYGWKNTATSSRRGWSRTSTTGPTSSSNTSAARNRWALTCGAGSTTAVWTSPARSNLACTSRWDAARHSESAGPRSP